MIIESHTHMDDNAFDEDRDSIISEIKKPHQATIFLSHIHQDHIQGLQFYKPLFIPTSSQEPFEIKNNVSAQPRGF